MKHILFVVTSHNKTGATGEPTGFYLSEVTHPHKTLVDAGYKVEFVSPQGGEAPIDGLDLTDPLNKAFIDNPAYVKQIKQTHSPDRIDPDNYTAIFYAGGHGTMWDFPENSRLASIAASIYEKGGVVAAVCHGPAGLVNIKLSNGKYLVDGKDVSSFTNEEEEAVGLTATVPFSLEDALKSRGAKYSKASPFEKHIVVSERLVSGQNPQSALGVGEALVNCLSSDMRV